MVSWKCARGKGLCSNVYYYETDESVLFIDSGNGTIDLSALAKGRDVTILLTHTHFDHSVGCKTIPYATVYVHPAEREYISLPLFWLPTDAKDLTHKSFVHGNRCFEIIHTPGHTMGSICVYEPEERVLFSGDTLFAQGIIGRTDIGGDDALMQCSLKQVQQIPYEVLAPGHDDIEYRKESKLGAVKKRK